MNFGNHEPRETVHGREKYKWVLLVFLFVAFFLELGSRQLYSAGVTGSGFAVAFSFFMYASLVWLFKRDYIADGEPQGGGR